MTRPAALPRVVLRKNLARAIRRGHPWIYRTDLLRPPNLPQGGGPALIGGRGTLNTPKFKITVESYWPYASTLFDYITRAMPYTAPGSLKPDEVYSLVAFILGEGNIVGKNAVMDAKSLPKVQMPNKDGFYPDDRPYPVKRYD